MEWNQDPTYSPHQAARARIWAVTRGGVSEFRRQSPRPEDVLLRAHRGDLITQVFGSSIGLATFALAVVAFTAWLVRWPLLFHSLERWPLVLGFVDQLVLLLFLYFLVYLTYLRTEHLRHLPKGRFVPLLASAVLLRWLGEASLTLAAGIFVHSLLSLGMGELTQSGGSWAEIAPFVARVVGVPLAAGVLVGAIGAFVLCQALAALIDIALSIELNTRGKESHEPVRGVAFSGQSWSDS